MTDTRGIIRQGDVALIPVQTDAPNDYYAPRRYRPETLASMRARDARARAVLAFGEATGHHHSLEGTLFAPREREPDFVEVGEGGATLSHQEHDRLDVPPGKYRVQRQREWDGRSTVRVAD